MSQPPVNSSCSISAYGQEETDETEAEAADETK